MLSRHLYIMFKSLPTTSPFSSKHATALVRAQRRTQTLSYRIGTTVLVSCRDGKEPRAEYCVLFRGLDVNNRNLFETAMTKCIAEVTEKLPMVVDVFVDKVVDKCLSDLLPHHVYLELKDKRGENIHRVAVTTVGAHASKATATAAAAPPPLLSPSEPPPAASSPNTRYSQLSPPRSYPYASRRPDRRRSIQCRRDCRTDDAGKRGSPGSSSRYLGRRQSCPPAL